MDPNNTNAPTAIPWWQSRIIWAQLVAAAFAIAGLVKAAVGFDLAARFGMNQEQLLAAIMLIVPAITITFRIINPTPQVTGTKAAAVGINRAAAIVASTPTVASQPEEPSALDLTNRFSRGNVAVEESMRSVGRAKPKAKRQRKPKAKAATPPPAAGGTQ